MKGNQNDYNSLDLEGDSTLDNNKKININSNIKIEQVGNNNNLKENERDSIQSGSTTTSEAPTPKTGGFFGGFKKFFKLEEESENSQISNKNNNLESGMPNKQAELEEEGVISSKINKCKQAVIKKIEENLEVEKSYKTFTILIFIGLALLCLSLMFLPVVILSPSKFVMCFSLGSIIILASFIFVYGTKSYVEKLFSKDRFPFSILFIISIIFGLYFSLSGNYLVSILFAAVQLVTLIVFTLTFVPGGSSGISFIGGMLISPIKGLWGRITGQATA